ncbi:MAG: RNA ligase (ATP) [Myxococcota bacterium]|jgi:RNA ligase (TIGR02306 family)
MQATVAKVISVTRHPNADALDVITVLGWQCVAKIGEFRPGDLVAYVFIDSVMPDRSEFAFLGSSRRVKTRMIRGELSQGICFPMSIVPEGAPHAEGDDLTELLGVTHYEKPIPAVLGAKSKGDFPSFVPKTDEPMIQSCAEVLGELEGLPYYITEKANGSSTTVFFNQGVFGVCSRNFEIENDGRNTYWAVAGRHGLEGRFHEMGRNLAVQAELVGPGIQKNELGLKQHELFVFNVYDIDSRRILGYAPMMEVVGKLGLPSVRLIEQGDSFGYDMQTLLKMAAGIYEGTKNRREGIVVRPLEPVYSNVLRTRLSFKVLSNEYLVKEG